MTQKKPYNYRFKQADVKRALKGVEDAGQKASGIEIDANGTIKVFIGEQKATASSDWDEVLND